MVNLVEFPEVWAAVAAYGQMAVVGAAMAGGVISHGEGSYEASYVVRRSGEYQLVVGLVGNTAKTVFHGVCAPGPVAPAICEVQHATSDLVAGQTGQLRIWTADRCSFAISYAHCHVSVSQSDSQ